MPAHVRVLFLHCGTHVYCEDVVESDIHDVIEMAVDAICRRNNANRQNLFNWMSISKNHTVSIIHLH